MQTKRLPRNTSISCPKVGCNEKFRGPDRFAARRLLSDHLESRHSDS